MERVTGIAPVLTPWKGVVLLLYYTRMVGVPRFELGINPPKGLVLAVTLYPVITDCITKKA